MVDSATGWKAALGETLQAGAARGLQMND